MMVIITKLGNNKGLKPQDKQTKRQEKGLTKQEVESRLQKSEKLSQKGTRLAMSDKIPTNPFSRFFTSSFVTVLAKTCIVCTKIEFNFITTVDRHTQYLSIPSISSVKC